MKFNTLISVSELAGHLGEPNWVICDCRHDLADTDAGRRAYRDSHIPGARFVHLDQDLSAPKTGRNGRHPLPAPEAFARRLGQLGVSSSSQVVAYDASGGYYAARLWWMLRWLGHESAAVLDGGWGAWTAAGLPVTDKLPAVAPVSFEARLRSGLAVDAGTVAAGNHLLVDARAPNRYRGENETLDPVAGHIPGAVNRFFQSNLDGNGAFKRSDTLRKEFEAIIGHYPPAGVVHYCGSGVTACHNLLAMEIADLAGSRLYPGSWSEWISDRSRPVARGSAEQGPHS